MQDELGNQAFLDVMILDELLLQRDPKKTLSGINSSPFYMGTPSKNSSLSRLPGTLCKPLNTIVSLCQVDTVTPAEPSGASQIFSMSDEGNGEPSKAPVATSSPSASTPDNGVDRQAKPPDPRYPGFSSPLSLASNVSYGVEMDPISTFPSADAASTQANQGSNVSTYASSESDSEADSWIKVGIDSGVASNFGEQLRGSSEEYDKIIIGHEHDLRGAYPNEHPWTSNIELELPIMDRESARIVRNTDMTRIFGPWKEYMHISPSSQWPYYIEAAETKFGDQTTQCHSTAQDSSENSEDIQNWRRDWWKMTSPHDDSHLSRRSQSGSTIGGAEPNSDVSFASGFRFTAYAAVLETGGGSQSDDDSDSPEEGEKYRPTDPRPNFGSKSPEDRCSEQVNGPVITLPNCERQSSIVSTSLRYGPSNTAKHLPGIDEDSESDDNKSFFGHLVKRLHSSSDRLAILANSEETPDDTITPSGRALYDSNKAMPNDNGPCRFDHSDQVSNDGAMLSPLASFTSENLNIRIQQKASRNNLLPNPLVPKEQKRVASLVEIFQARGVIGAGLRSGLQRTFLSSNPQGSPRSAPCRILTPSEAVYSHLAATLTPSYYPPPVKRVSTPLSDANTEASSLFGEQLERFGRSPVGSSEDEGQEESEKYFQDSLIYG
jgi:hypothetical protein